MDDQEKRRMSVWQAVGILAAGLLGPPVVTWLFVPASAPPETFPILCAMLYGGVFTLYFVYSKKLNEM